MGVTWKILSRLERELGEETLGFAVVMLAFLMTGAR
jgi:hypothetical protein